MLTFEQSYTMNKGLSLTPATIFDVKTGLVPMDFKHYIPEIVPIIDQIIESGKYPYNSTVEEAVKKDDRFFGMTDRLIELHVYNAQCYHEAKKIQDSMHAKQAELTAAGYIPATDAILNALLKSRRFVTIYTQRTGEIKARIVKGGDNLLYWVKPRFKTKGYKADIGDYVKAA